jgi:hypothetical protein
MANKNNKTENRTVYSLTSNSRTGQVSRGVEERKVAAGTPKTSASRRFNDKPASDWSNAQYGSKFSRGDIGKLQDKGFNQNQIMKIAQMAYASGNVKNLNKTNQGLYDLSNGYLNKPTSSMTLKGQTMYGSPYGMDAIGNPKKVFGWNGFGDSMSINKYGGSGYNQSGVWTLPGKYSNPTKPTLTGTGSGSPGPTDAPGSTDTEQPPIQPTPNGPTPVVTEPTNDVGMLSGGGAGINGAAGVKRKKSSWSTQGKSSKGTSNLNRSLTVSGYNMN